MTTGVFSVSRHVNIVADLKVIRSCQGRVAEEDGVP